jgi:hypothetical protein
MGSISKLDSAEKKFLCFDKHVLSVVEGLSMNGKIINVFRYPPPFALSRRVKEVFQQNPSCGPIAFARLESVTFSFSQLRNRENIPPRRRGEIVIKVAG